MPAHVAADFKYTHTRRAYCGVQFPRTGLLDSMACGTWESAERVFLLARDSSFRMRCENEAARRRTLRVRRTEQWLLDG
jgi:hypothetical protein